MDAPYQSLGKIGQILRFDVYLCLKDKDGVRVPFAKLQKIRREIVKTFHGITHTTIVGNPIYTGLWKQSGARKPVQDHNTIYTVLTPRTEDSYEFFLKRKEGWRTDLKYDELLITVYDLEALPD
jgi:hypothetical protein